MKAWSLRTQFARALAYNPRILARLGAARQDSVWLKLKNSRLCAQSAPASDTQVSNISTATRLRELLTVLFEQYETTHGISCNAYCDTPQWHAMAEAQYLEAVVISHSTGLLSSSQAKQRAKASVARLQVGALHRVDGVFAQWGLGFRWQSFPSNEPFLVTTALVTRALIAAEGLADCTDMAREGLAGLARLPHVEVMIDGEAVTLPVYAPSLPEVVENTVALWAQVIRSSHALSESGTEVLSDANRALDWLSGRLVPGLGWAYSSTRPVFDLMHQVYILEGLFNYSRVTEIDERAIEVFAGFRTGSGYIDSLTLTSRDKALESAERSGDQYPVFRGNHVLSARADPARFWSLGGMLGSFALFAQHSERRGYWLSQIRRFPIQMLPERFGADFRQEMHLARGAALALKALRDQDASGS